MFRHYLSKLGNKAQALIISYIIISVFIIISGILLTKGISEKNIVLRNRLANEVFYLAEGATENAIRAFITAIGDYQIDTAAASFPDPGDPTEPYTSTFTTFGGATVDTTVTCLEDDDRLITEGATNILVRNYEVISTATHPQNDNITIKLHQIIARRLIPTFQHAVFYNDDLEMLPGKNMELGGRVHSNQDIYLDAEGGATLKVDSDYLRSAGNIYNQRKDNGSQLGGDALILVKDSSPSTFEYMNNLDCDIPTWATEAITRWNGTVQSSAHGVTTLAIPSVGSIQPGGYYASNADVVIVNGVITKGGVDLEEGVDYPVGTVEVSTTFYNNREDEDIKMTEIDLRKLANADGELDGGGIPFPNNLPSNGLLYATRNDAGTNQPGIRLKNASEIFRTGGLTVTSNDPVYLQGDFNTANEKPASVICDSLNLLSNNWDDANDELGLGSRIATVTTINCAFIAGIDETTAGNYNGGLENYPRMHEKWSSVDLNISGSFVALWDSVIATGAWEYGDPQYEAPQNRNWDYNPNFNDVAKLPPCTPWAVEAQRIAWWKE